MTIHLSTELEQSINVAVRDGHFASIDDAMAEAAQLLLDRLKRQPRPDTIPPLGSIGFMADAAVELDAAVADAMKQRREGAWREFNLE